MLDVVAAEEHEPANSHTVGGGWEQVRTDQPDATEQPIGNVVKGLEFVLGEIASAWGSGRPGLAHGFRSAEELVP